MILIGSGSLFAGSITTDFDSLLDGDLLTNQLPGIAASNAIIYSAGISLNEFEFPPRSGKNVASDAGGPVTVLFDAPLLTVSVYLTYLTPLTFQAFDSSNALLATANSAFSSNLALSGDAGSSPNELLSIVAAGIRKIVITGDSNGGSFTLDDLTYTPAPTGVPEPATALAGMTAMALITWRRK